MFEFNEKLAAILMNLNLACRDSRGSVVMAGDLVSPDKDPSKSPCAIVTRIGKSPLCDDDGIIGFFVKPDNCDYETWVNPSSSNVGWVRSDKQRDKQQTLLEIEKFATIDKEKLVINKEGY